MSYSAIIGREIERIETKAKALASHAVEMAEAATLCESSLWALAHELEALVKAINEATVYNNWSEVSCLVSSVVEMGIETKDQVEAASKAELEAYLAIRWQDRATSNINPWNMQASTMGWLSHDIRMLQAIYNGLKGHL